MRVQDVFTHIDNVEDVQFLKSEALPVNMRLFRSSESYKRIIRCVCKELRSLALTDLEGYSRPYGISCANIAVPFNIIGVVHNRGTAQAACSILINPKIVEVSDRSVVKLSNCGSIRLVNPIPVRRYEWVRVSYFDESGTKRMQTFTVQSKGATIQHEIDHNMGILITEREAVGGS